MQTGPEPPPIEADLITRVVAWHNRHPLARRIMPSQVCGLGVVALPFGPAPARRRAPALFSEDFISPLKTAAIARLAWRHGSTQQPANQDWPQREIPIDARSAGTAAEMRYLRTAAIEVGSRRIRVLIGDGVRPRIIGPRFWSRRRSGWLMTIVTVLAVGGVVTERDWQEPEAPGVMIQAQLSADTPHQPASAALAETPRVLDSPASAAFAASIESADAAPADAEPPEPIASATPAEARPAAPGRTAPQAAADDVDDAAPEVRVSTPIAERRAAPHSVEPQQPAAQERAAYALASASTTTLLASQLRIGLMNLPIEPAANRPHAEVMRVGTRWRVVIWPFDSRPAAEALRKSLAEQGMKTELIGF